MRRRFIADTFSPATGHPTHASLTGDQAAHLARVLRAQPGQSYDLVANGFLHRAEIAAVSPTEVAFLLHEELQADGALPIHLYLALFKFDHFEWAIEKATELGASRITPILAHRTEKHLALAAPKRVERWRRIALESAKQSRRTDIPAILDPIALATVLGAPCLASETGENSRHILLSETEHSLTLTAALTNWDQAATPRALHPSQSHRYDWDGNARSRDLALAIGPEGGWTPEEMSLFLAHHWTPVTLGPRILRAETAAIAAIAIVASHLTAKAIP